MSGRFFERGVGAVGCGVCERWWLNADEPQCDCQREAGGEAVVARVDAERGIVTYEADVPRKQRETC